MVLINGIKYACERCIRGHRVTTCSHTDQPLIMIKPKGRPSTTCQYCKELRKHKGATPPGTCTCGRLEKKRLAQKAKEKARIKAKELETKNCTCDTDIPCVIHSKKNKRTTSHRKSKPRSGAFQKVNSSTSLDSNFFSGSSILSDSSNILSSSFIDSDILSGKISKDYHHVPSLASISSMHSSYSSDQNISTPQSPPLSALQFNFNTGAFNQPTIHNNYRNWDNSNNKNGSSSQINLNLLNSTKSNNQSLDNKMSIGSPQNTNQSTLISPPLRPSNIGEVIVPLEEFIPPDLNGVGKVTDNTSYVNNWDLNGETGSYKYCGSQAESRKSSIVPSIKSNDDYSIHKFGKQTSDRQPPASNGLLDMFLDSSSISTLSKASVLLQDKSNKLGNNRFRDQKIMRDTDSVRSVEVLSLTPSFMDIPGNDVTMQRNAYLNRDVSSIPNGINDRPRSSSIDRNHKFFKGSVNTINPMVVNSVSDVVDLGTNDLVQNYRVDDNINSGAFDCRNNNSNDIIDKNFDNNNSNNAMKSSEPSPIDTMQFSSPPSQLLSEQGFADLDNFMSTL